MAGSYVKITSVGTLKAAVAVVKALGQQRTEGAL